MKTVIHVDDPEKWELALTNAGNIIKYGEQTGTDFRIEIVANGAAVENLREDRARADRLPAGGGKARILVDLNAQTVAEAVAEVSPIAAAGIREGSLIPFIEVVPSGAVELIRRQKEGYAYLKP